MLDLIYKGLSNLPSDLGDRSTYVGSSDVGGCIRKSVLSKKYPPVHDLATLIRFQRGHLAETIIQMSLDISNVPYQYQLEVCHPDAPLKSHADFVFSTPQEAAILEVKSVSDIPEDPYEGWVMQLNFQLGLLAMNKTDAHVRGAILALNLNTGETRMFNGYNMDPEIFGGLVTKAETIWDYMNTEADQDQDIPTEKGPLCSWCVYRSDCPAFDLEEDVPEAPVENEVQEYLGLKEQQKDISARVKKLSSLLKSAIGNTNPDERKIRAGDHIVALRDRSRSGIDSKKLKENHPDIYEECTKKSSYPVLLVD
jgi:hypothetical protein